MNFGERVHLMRRRRKMTQQALADAVGVSKATIFRIEKGDFADTMGQTIAQLARVFNVSGDYLLGLKEEPEPLEKVAQEAWAYRRDHMKELLHSTTATHRNEMPGRLCGGVLHMATRDARDDPPDIRDGLTHRQRIALQRLSDLP